MFSLDIDLHVSAKQNICSPFKSVLRGLDLTCMSVGILLNEIGNFGPFPHINCYRVAIFKCPRLPDDQKMSEDNQNLILRPGCHPPDYH